MSEISDSAGICVTSVVLFVLTFKVLGLLLGFAAVYEPAQGNKSDSIAIVN